MPAPEGNQYAAGNPGGGRPSSYKPEYAVIAEKMCNLGATDMEIADAFQVSVRTIYAWKHEHEEFSSALNAGKDKADERVTHSLYQRAVGYEQEAVKIFMPAGAEDPVYAPYREKIAADTTAAIFWLKNRKPEEWREKIVNEHTGKDGDAIKIETNDIDVARRIAFALAKGAAATEKP